MTKANCKPKLPPPEHQMCLKHSSDDWHPTYHLANFEKSCLSLPVRTQNPGFVRMSFMELRGYTSSAPRAPIVHPDRWRVSIWGGDDTGMEQDFLDRNQALAMFHEVIALPDVTKDDLTLRGFDYV